MLTHLRRLSRTAAVPAAAAQRRLAIRTVARKLAVLVWLGVASSAFAHEDRVLTLQPDGSLREIPAQFGRATADIRWAEGDPIQVTLTLGANSYRVPACIAKLIRTRDRRDIELTGSWYPPGQRSNYYLSMYFYDPGAKHSQIGGEFVWLTFDLLSAELRSVWVQRYWFLSMGLSVDREAMTRYCRPQELKAAARRAEPARPVD